jgi:threonine/homoserine/homoserine lactone efflux protein
LVALGVSASDTLIVIICYFGVARFMADPTVKSYMAYVGGGILVLFGIYYLFIKSRKGKQSNIHVVEERKLYRYMVKGFVLNGFTPTVLLFWLGTISIASLDFGYVKGFEFFIFFASLLITVLSTDVLKAYLADKLRTLVTQRLLTIMNVLLGIVMIAFGVRLILLSTLSGI